MENSKVYKGFLIDGVIYVSDSDSMRIKDVETGKMKEVEQIPVVIEKDLMKFWIEECGLLDELGIDASLWS